MRTQVEWEALVELSDAELWGGNYLNARTARSRLALAQTTGWSQAGYAMVAILSADLGDAEGAEDALRATEQTMDRPHSDKSWSSWKSDYTARFDRARANVLRAKGKISGSRGRTARCHGNTDISIEVNPRYRYAVQSSLEARREELEVELAYLLIAQGRLQEAEWHARITLQRTLKRVSGNSPEIVNRLGPLIEILYLEGRFDESRALTSVARDMLMQSGAQPVARGFSLLLGAEGRSLVALGEYGPALERYGQLRANLASDSALQRSYGLGDADWALALLRSGKPAAAAEICGCCRRALLSMGAGHLKTGVVQGELGMALAAQGDRDGALAQFKPAMESLLDPHNLNDAPPATMARIGIIVEAYIALLAELQRTGDRSPGNVDPVAEAFRVADAVRGRSVQRALAESAARSIAGTPFWAR